MKRQREDATPAPGAAAAPTAAGATAAAASPNLVDEHVALQTALHALQTAGVQQFILQQSYSGSAFPFPVPVAKWDAAMGADAFAAFQQVAAASSGGALPGWPRFGVLPASGAAGAPSNPEFNHTTTNNNDNSNNSNGNGQDGHTNNDNNTNNNNNNNNDGMFYFFVCVLK